ncbi:hypothetical protein TYRP_008814 [Tyrophagus putrescentiae]|nr:hypothetical protein TYRP_008814 [Tyrophagus putrescentiae]
MAAVTLKGSLQAVSFRESQSSEVCNQEELALGAVVANWSDPEAPAVLINLSFDYRAVVNQCQWLVVGNLSRSDMDSSRMMLSRSSLRATSERTSRCISNSSFLTIAFSSALGY